MAKSARYVVHNAHGRSKQNFNMPGVIKSRQAVVHITASEVTAAPASVVAGGGTQNFMYNVGAANVWVSNVSPHFNDHFQGEPGGVEYILNVDWQSPLNVAVTVTVEDDPPFSIQQL